MRALKLVTISAVILFLLVTGISSLLPSEIRVSRAIDINASRDSVARILGDLSTWKKWNEFVKALPAENVSADSLTSPQLHIVMNKVTPTEITSTWTQPGRQSLPAAYMIFSTKNLLTVQWYFTCRFKWYPWEKLGSIIYDKQLGAPMEQSLQNLKKLAESPAPNAVDR